MGILNNFFVRIIVVIVALLSPWICFLSIGELNSYSQYWTTDIRPLFIFTNASTSYFLVSSERWRFPALALMLLTAFSYDQYFWIHNVTAIAFFILCAIAIATGPLRYYIVFYLSSIILLFSSGIFWAEVFAITVTCAYHLHLTLAYKRIENARKKLRIK